MDNAQAFEEKLMRQIVELALWEDRVQQDVTTNALMEYDRKVTAAVIAKSEGVISGIEVLYRCLSNGRY